MNVRAKFKVNQVTHVDVGANNTNAVVELVAATTGPGNESWSKWTPAGTIKMTITNPDADVFKPGAYFFVDFSPAD